MLSSTPIVQPVTVQRQVCVPQQVVTLCAQWPGRGDGGDCGRRHRQRHRRRRGRDIATGAGLIGGAILGNQIEGSGAAQTQTVQQCSMQNVMENRVTGYNVTWDYAGRQYTTQMAYDPGAWVRVQVVPVEGVSATVPAAPAPYAPAPVQLPAR
ncbi:MAG: hypothetical protein HZY78_01965 [Burkholderiaceae bacterium]|nr:MAG: hypothetical protein HZY78_01965 [Burkholderiaceae bacterium]